MNDFEGLLNSDYGFKPQGKAAPMAARSSSARSTTPGYGNFIDEDDPIFNPSRGGRGQGLGSMDGFDDVFGGPPKYSSTPDNRRKGEEFDFDNMFGGQVKDVKGSVPVFDKPVFDEEEDVFAGEHKGSSSNDFENVFASMGAPQNGSATSPFDDLLGGSGGSNSFKKDDGINVKKDAGDFDDLLPGFGGSSPASARHTTGSASEKLSHVKEDPFSGLDSPLTQEGPDSGIFTDPLDEIGKLGKNGNTVVDESPIGVFEAPFDSGKEMPSRTASSTSGRHAFHSEMLPEKISADSPGSSRKKSAQNNTSDSYQSMFGMPSNTNNSYIFGKRSGSPPSYDEYIPSDINSPSTATIHNTEVSDDIWLTVSEIPLFTQPTSAPPPSRPPPPRPARVRKTEVRAPSPRTNATDFPSIYNSTQNSRSFKSGTAAARSSVDELEDLSKGKAYAHSRAHTDAFDENSQAQSDATASAAVMKEVMNRAEAKFRHAKELRERENAKAFRNRENNTPKDDVENLDRKFKIKEEEELEKQGFEQQRMRTRELEREREEKDREQKRLESERERAREEREKARQAVERATREARERAAADARLRAEKAAVEKANSEARERAERLAVQRAQAEARERAAAEAKERAEKAAVEARARSNAEAKERAAKAENEARIRSERAAVERAAKEARERAAEQARERAAAHARERASATRANQQKSEDDFESFFGTGSRPSSVPRASANNSGTEDARRTSSSTSNIRKTSSATSIVDDLSSIFGGSPLAGSFQEMEGETEERRRARLERDQRTNERAAKALAEKNERDLQAQREQAERHRFSESLDAEIKRWAAGKEGNIRALLSTMQYILWPECGWQPVSLTDLITGASVKKAYRKATLCIHPDKVQQKGANLQQKYIAEKVFDLLKEAWNKFNSEELF